MPMSFIEIDEAKAEAAKLAPSGKRGKKRKNATIARLNPSSQIAAPSGNSTTGSGGTLPLGEADKTAAGENSDLRTGRWTNEETAYCDQLIEKFEKGQLPIVDGIKLNDFLSNMLKSKQSRLTKKMKNARLSARCYKRSTGFISEDKEARAFSEAESAFFDSIPCNLEKSEIKFHMQKEWRELYSSYCVSIGQKLDADAWLSSVEEMDRRASEAKDAARMARRKVMMGYALSHDASHADQGVFIEPNACSDSTNTCCPTPSASTVAGGSSGSTCDPKNKKKSNKLGLGALSSSPFVGRVVQFLQRYNIPFEHVDAWVPSFVPQQSSGGGESGASTGEQKCRLCFAGSASTETVIPPDGGSAISLTPEEQFDLISFGEYSQKFSFDLGCGLPGRVYSSGVASWEQGIQKAPSALFERCGGAAQWQIQTVLGIPVPSPNVGRVVVLLYSRHDRNRDQDIVNRVSSMLTKVSQFDSLLNLGRGCHCLLKHLPLPLSQLMPTPKWKLVVDVAAPAQPESGNPAALQQGDNRANELLTLIRTFTPADKTSPLAAYLPGFTSLRLLLEKPSRTTREEDLAQTLVESYSSYQRTGMPPSDIASMVARDYMMLSQSPAPQPLLQQQQQQQVPAAGVFQQQNAVSASVSRQSSQNANLPPPANQQQIYSNAQQVAQHVLPFAFRQLTQSTHDFQQQLPGQPSA
jgi:hypothetical protein